MSRRRGRGPKPKKKRRDADDRVVEGRIQHHGKFAFLLSESPEGSDIHLKGGSLRLAMHGDRVRVKIRSRGGRAEARIIEVLERARKTVVGTLRREGRRWIVAPEGADAVQVLGFGRGIRAEAGALAVVRISRWPTETAPAAGHVVERLGRPEAPRVRATAVLRSRELPESFPEDVLRESRRFPTRVLKGAWKGRLNLFHLPLFTIDGADAKDFDDAVSLEETGGGKLRLGVHIADVSHYVRPGTALDREAFRRATSVYLPDRTVPMLPPNLSDHLCSLMPHVERLAVSCFLDLDPRGRVLNARFADSVIRSSHRFTYEEVERILLGARPRSLPKGVLKSVLAMGDLAGRLTAIRFKRGALDFDMPEHKVEVDSRGVPVSVKRVDRLASHRLIEEFMILANEAAARHLIRRRIPAPHRIHPEPDPRKLEALGGELKRLGVKVPGNIGSPDGAGVRTALRRAQGHPLRDMITVLAVRSLKQAVYSAEPSPHFGLASKAYTHFTSPIRRYPDLMVHRAIKSAGKGKRRGRDGGDLVRAAAHCSERERMATDAERKAVDILRAQLLAQEKGRLFDGVVVRQLPYGAFVELQDNGAQGLMRGAKARMGDKVRVRVGKVDLVKGEIDLIHAGNR